jgi:thymidylate synthase
MLRRTSYKGLQIKKVIAKEVTHERKRDTVNSWNIEMDRSTVCMYPCMSTHSPLPP